MKKKILFSLLLIVALFLVYVAYVINNPVSPLKTVSFQNKKGFNFAITGSPLPSRFWSCSWNMEVLGDGAALGAERVGPCSGRRKLLLA